MSSWFWKRWARLRTDCRSVNGPLSLPSVARRGKRREQSRAKLLLEALEDRLAPATFNVNSFADTDAVNLSTGQDQNGSISLRSAIEAANYLEGDSTINLQAGTYSLVSHFAAPGPLADLTIADYLTSVGAGSKPTSIDGGGLGRVFQVAGSATVVISGVWIGNGLATDAGGGITNSGNLTLTDDVLHFNRVVAGPGNDAGGGCIFNTSGSVLTLDNIQVTNSAATGGAGSPGRDGAAGSSAGLPGSAGTAGGNGGAGLGGAIFNDGGNVNISASVFALNTAVGGAGGKGGAGGAGFNTTGGSDVRLPGAGGSGANAGNGGGGLGGSIYNNGGSLTITSRLDRGHGPGRDWCRWGLGRQRRQCRRSPQRWRGRRQCRQRWHRRPGGRRRYL